MKLLAASLAVVFTCVLVQGQVQEKVLYSFSGAPDCAQPVSKLLVDSSGNLFGTTKRGGDISAFPCFGTCGTIFELSPDGRGNWSETVLYSFCQQFDGLICLDGQNPLGGLISDSLGNLYGTASSGGGDNCPYGGGGCGTVFELSPPTIQGGTWTFSLLYQFCQIPGDLTCSDGAWPYSKLTFDASGNLYGTTSRGGNNGGVVFELSPSKGAWTETVLYTFCASGQWPACPDGSVPEAGVTFDQQGNLYGTTSAGGSPKFEGGGVVYELSNIPAGWSESVLYAVGNGAGPKGGVLTGSLNFDASGNMYTSAFQGGKANRGTVFQLSRDNGGTVRAFQFNGTDGANPTAGVLINPRNSNLYGTTSAGGVGYGTVFKIAGKTEKVLYNFLSSDNGDGAYPMAGLVADRDGHLYGTTKLGGSSNNGTVFEIVP